MCLYIIDKYWGSFLSHCILYDNDTWLKYKKWACEQLNAWEDMNQC